MLNLSCLAHISKFAGIWNAATVPCKYQSQTDEVTRSAFLKFHRGEPFLSWHSKKMSKQNSILSCFFLSFSFLRTNVTGVSRAHRADSKIGTAADWAGWICFCRKTTPRNHRKLGKRMLLCWLDVKWPCVLYQNGEESLERSGQTSAPSALSPFWCLMLRALEFPCSRKPCR